MISPTRPNQLNDSNNHHADHNHENQLNVINKILIERPVQTKKHRCWSCRKKVGLMGIECRCGYIFCIKHQNPIKHDCDFDIKAMHREKLRDENPLVEKDKMPNRL